MIVCRSIATGGNCSGGGGCGGFGDNAKAFNDIFVGGGTAGRLVEVRGRN